MTNLDPSAGFALASQRHLFDIPDEVAFLNCAYISPLPKASLIAGDRGLRRKAQPWTIAAADFFTSSETVRRLFAGLINADADDVAFAPAVSYGMAQAAHNILIRRTQRIVTLSEQFPSNVYPWMDLAERTGAAFVSVPRLATTIGRRRCSPSSMHRPASWPCRSVIGSTAGSSTSRRSRLRVAASAPRSAWTPPSRSARCRST